MRETLQLPIRIDLAIDADLLNEYPTPMSNMREAEWRLRHPRMERGALTMRKHRSGWSVGSVDSCGSNSDPFVAGCDGPCLLLPLLL